MRIVSVPSSDILLPLDSYLIKATFSTVLQHRILYIKTSRSFSHLIFGAQQRKKKGEFIANPRLFETSETEDQLSILIKYNLKLP